jgi:proteasome lid subunit RPN8/RPN11
MINCKRPDRLANKFRSMTSSVLISPAIYNTISAWAEAAYPHEGCGLLIGRFEQNGIKKVERFAPLTNELLTKGGSQAPTLPKERQGAGAGKTEFVMSPDEFNRETLKAEKEGLDVVGVVHTHPDHPPRPSQIDASQPFLAQWSNIIVSVEKGKTKEMKSWFRDVDDHPFVEEAIRR